MTEDEINRAAAAKDDIGRQKVSGLLRIWLEPECCACRETGRVWCEDNVWPNSDCEATGTEYVRADVVAKLAKALKHAESVFEDYERMHHAKDTSDGYAKAATNRAHALKMRTAIAELTGEG